MYILLWISAALGTAILVAIANIIDSHVLSKKMPGLSSFLVPGTQYSLGRPPSPQQQRRQGCRPGKPLDDSHALNLAPAKLQPGAAQADARNNRQN